MKDKIKAADLISNKNDDEKKQEKTGDLDDWLDEIQTKDLKQLFNAVLRVMTEEYIAAKSPTMSSPNVQRLHLVESYLTHCYELNGRQWEEFKCTEFDAMYNNNDSRRRILKYLSNWVSETFVRPKLISSKAITHGCDGWKMKLEWYMHGARIVLEGGGVEYVFLQLIEPKERGAKGCYDSIFQAYLKQGVKWMEVEEKVVHFLFDRAAINVGCQSGVITRIRRKKKK
eukprot:464493_1